MSIEDDQANLASKTALNFIAKWMEWEMENRIENTQNDTALTEEICIENAHTATARVAI